MGKAVWSDQNTDDQKAEHRADPQAMDQGHDYAGGDEKDDHLAQFKRLDVHRSVRALCSPPQREMNIADRAGS
jgi:hypothetical protein